jgi:uncharacterized protein (DUF362 family)
VAGDRLKGGNMKEEFGCKGSLEDSGCESGISRRDFIRTAAVGTAGAALAGSHLGCSTAARAPRQGLGNLFMENEKPLLVVVEGDNLQKMLEAGLEAIGGLEKLVSGKSVVMKPNILNSQPPPVTTDVEIVLAVGQLARSAGASSLTACDACGKGVQKAEKFRKLGYPPRLEEAGIGIDAVDFNVRQEHVFVSKQGWTSHPSIGVVKTLYEADVVLNLPMIKRHGSARFTCALKNHFGSVFFPNRRLAHKENNSKTGEGRKFFEHALTEYADAVRPELNIVDGRALLVGGGARLGAGGAKIKDGINRIILCGDIVATDVYCSRLMEENDETYSHDMIAYQIESAEELGLGVGDLNNVVIKEIIA